MNLQIYKYISDNGIYDEDEPPVTLNYVTGLMPGKPLKSRTWVKGELVERIFFFGSDVPYVKEFRQYNWSADGLTLESLTAFAHYYYEDGTLHSVVRDISEVYDKYDGDYLGKKRRMVNIAHITSDMKSMASASSGTAGVDAASDLLVSLKSEIDAYIDASKPLLATAITNSVHPIFDSLVAPGITARMYVLNELT